MFSSLPSIEQVLIVAIPMIVAITFHEAAHGFVAWRLGDPTAYQQGRVTFNPIKHIDLFGTILLPLLLFLARPGLLFGWAKPVPINPSLLRSPRRDMMLVAAAGPGINLLLAILSGAALALLGGTLDEATFPEKLFSASIYLNALIGVFNLIPLPPLDGGRIAVGLLPASIAIPFARLENYGLWIVLGVLLILPIVTYQLGAEINIFTAVIGPIIDAVVDFVTGLTGAQLVRW